MTFYLYVPVFILLSLYLLSYLLYKLQIIKKIDLDIMETINRDNEYYNNVKLIIKNNKSKNIENLNIEDFYVPSFDKNKITKWTETYVLIKDIEIETIIRMNESEIDLICEKIEKIDQNIISQFSDSYEDKKTLILEIKESYHDMFFVIDSLVESKIKFKEKYFPLHISFFEKNYLGTIDMGITPKENFFYEDCTNHEIPIQYELNFNICMAPLMIHLLIKSLFKKNRNFFISFTKKFIKIKILEIHVINGIEVKNYTIKKHKRDYIFNMALYKNWKFNLTESSLILINKLENSYKSNKYYHALDLTTNDKNEIIFMTNELKKIHDLKTILRFNELIKMLKDSNQLSIADKIYLRKNYDI